MTRIVLLFVICLLSVPAGAQQLAFPGAEGFGRFATGGRTGTVYHVTNLNDSGKGSFRDAVSQPNRIIVFDVAGVIRLQSRVSVSRNLYIAGQTAPGEGVTLYGNGLSFTDADNTICRYLRVRMGVVGDSGADALTLASGSDMIFDHCSVAWGRDETFSISGSNPERITIQNCIISQGLLSHSAGGLVQTGGGVTIYRTLYIHNDTRNPKFKGTHQYTNNIVYNWKTAAYIMGGDSEGSSQANAVGNVFIAGPTGKSNAFSGANERYCIYEADNLVDDNHDGRLSLRRIEQSEFGGGPTFQSQPYDYPTLPTVAANGLLDDLLPTVGASLPYRDNHDWMLLDDVRSLGLRGDIISDERTLDIGAPDTWNLWPGIANPLERGSVVGGSPADIRTDTDGDGMPDWWEQENGTDDCKDDAMEIDANGYTNIENYINSITAHDSQYFLKAPVALKVVSREAEALLLQWRDMTDHEAGFAVEQLIDGSFVEIGRTEANITQWLAEGLTPTTEYTFRVRAIATVPVEGDLQSPSGYSNTVTATTRAQSADVTPPSQYQADIVWTGSESSVWDTTTANWTVGGGSAAAVQGDLQSPVAYTDGQRVLFADSAGGGKVSITGTVKPAAVMVNSSKDYELNGIIGGTTQLSKAGSGVLTLKGNSTYTGSTVVWDGTLQIATIGNAGKASPIGAGASWLLNGGIVRYTGSSASTDRELAIMQSVGGDLQSVGGDLQSPTLDIVNSGTTLTQKGTVTGEGNLTKTGAGTLLIPLGQLKTTGDVIVKEGKLTIQGKDAIGNNPQMKGTLHLQGGRFEVNGGDNAAEGIISMPIVVEGDKMSYLHVGQRNFIKGRVSGTGNLTIEVEYLREVYQGDWRQFYGTVTAKQTGSQGNQFYIDNAGYGGLPNARLDLQGILEMRAYSNAKTYRIGALTGSSSTTLACCFLKKDGGSVTWRIGGLGTDETFSGQITNGIEHKTRIGLTNIVKEGEGIWRVNGACKYRGTTRIEGGTFIMNGAHSKDKDYTNTYFTPGQYTVCSGATLSGKGSTEAPVVVQDGGTLAPGDQGIGTLTVKNDVTLQSGCQLTIEVNRSSKTNDRLTCQGTLTVGGTLHVQLNAGNYLDGDVMTILSAKSYSGNFDAIEPLTPAEGLLWDTSTLLSDGKLRVKTDELSGIAPVKAEVKNSPAYNINGQRITTPSKGIYIKNGKKAIIR